MGWWIYNASPEGSCFGPASEETVQAWKESGMCTPIPFKYHGYHQRVVLVERNDALTHDVANTLHSGADQKDQ